MSHHDGLKDAVLRDFLARQAKPTYVSTGLHANNPDFRQHLIHRIQEAQTALQDYDTGVALARMLQELGWTTHDVSDHVEGGYNARTYIHFVGTSDECDEVYPDLSREE